MHKRHAYIKSSDHTYTSIMDAFENLIKEIQDIISPRANRRVKKKDGIKPKNLILLKNLNICS